MNGSQGLLHSLTFDGIRGCCIRLHGDAPFVEALNEVREGRCSDATAAALRACHVSTKPRPSDGIEPTRLYCTNRNVDAENTQRLARLPGVEVGVEAVDVHKDGGGGGGMDGAAQRKVLELLAKKAPARLALKVGAQVVLLRNDAAKGLANGSRGVVVRISLSMCVNRVCVVALS